MSSWITITDADVIAAMNAQEVAALNAVQGSGGNGLTTTIQRITTSVRGKIKAGGGQVGAPGTIPESLLDDVICAVVWRWINAFSSNPKLMTDGRKNLAAAADANFKAISKKDGPRVELPDPADLDTSPAPVNAVQTVRPGRCPPDVNLLGNS